jgi:hypothetical protein
MTFLVSVPASAKANGGAPSVIALPDPSAPPREVRDYLARFRSQVSILAGNHDVSEESPSMTAGMLVMEFWATSPYVVFCREDDYASGLMASTLAARLRAPLYTTGDAGLSRSLTAQLRRLDPEETLFVGKAPEGVKATELTDVRAVIAWLKKNGHETDYLAVVNVRDRSSTQVKKLSLAAPIFAAARDGMVVPLDLDVMWRKPFTGTPLKGDLPKGVPAGGKKPPRKGVIGLPEGKLPFVVSYGKSGKDYRLNLDLNNDGAFDGEGEGPLKGDRVMTLLGKTRTVTFGLKRGTKADVVISTVRAEDVAEQLRELYRDIGVPKYLCLVGFPDAIPQAILPKGHTDMTSDLLYANADDDLFSEIAVGRIIGENATFATLHASRVVTYDSLLDPSWSGKAGQARWENTMVHNFENVGLDASAFHDVQHLKWIEKPSEKNKRGKRAKSIDQESPLCHVRFLTHMAHSWWKDIGQTYDMDSTVLLAPVVVESGGCLTACLDYEPGFRSVVSRFFRNGAVCFVGQTRPGIAHQEQQRAQFWHTVLTGGTIGDAHRSAQNSMTNTVLETGQAKGGPDHYQLHIRSLFGDPGFAPHVPSAPRSAPARVEVKDNTVSVHAPETWWPVRMRVPEDWKQWKDKPLYVVRGAGTYPHRYWCKEQYDKEETYVNAELTTSRRVKSITQVQSPPKPLGWTGKHTVDEHADGTRTYRWRVRVIDFDQKAGKIINKVDRLDYRVAFEE